MDTSFAIRHGLIFTRDSNQAVASRRIIENDVGHMRLGAHVISTH